MFVTVGDSDSLNEFEGSSGRAEKFFLAAAANFSPARLDYQPGPHVFQPQQLKDSYKAIARYILSDY